METEITGIIRLLKIIKDHVSIKGTNVLMSSFNSGKEVVNFIDDHIDLLSKSDISKINDLIVLFLPTSDFQEISISNGWGDKYLEIAKEFDDLINSLQKRSVKDE